MKIFLKQPNVRRNGRQVEGNYYELHQEVSGRIDFNPKTCCRNKGLKETVKAYGQQKATGQKTFDGAKYPQDNADYAIDRNRPFQQAMSRATATRPYAEKLAAMAESASQSASGMEHPLLKVNEGDRSAMIVLTSDRGLCGGV